ncbi:MAG TPA: HAMP domain-containing sensor histidine kinase [Rhizomicrobium sp.]|jgi:signal transduction histidine kinase|nr:HAMP domain-containing sensor histidine kinase [Rhizomicrobium sp.]
MRSSRIFRTASFKLAAAYAILFSASVAVLAAVVYFSATAALERQEHLRLQAEAQALRDEFNHGGLGNALHEIQTRTRAHLAGGFDYGIVTSTGSRIYGDIPRIKLQNGWTRAKGPPDGDEPPGKRERLLVYSTELKPGLWLQVGDDVGREKVFGRAIMATFAWFLLVVATLAIAGGVIISVSVLARIDAITRTAEAIIEGDLDRRVPLRGVSDDIDRLASTLNRMLDRISLLLRVLRQVSRHIAHDLRTPLGRLRQGLEDARKRAVNASDYERAIEKAVAETDEILATFAALLRIAQIESGTRRAGFQSVDLSALVQQIADSYSPVAEDAQKQLKISIMPEVKVSGDRELLTQLLVNLIENAIRHTQNGSQIVVEVLGGRRPALVVSDDGPGMPEEERKRIESRSYREESGRRDGNGLGLTLVAAVTDLHHAELRFSDCRPGAAVCILFAQIDLPESTSENLPSKESRVVPFPRLGGVVSRSRPQPLASPSAVGRGMPRR